MNDLLFATPDIAIEECPDGSRILRSRQELKPYPRRLGEWLDYWARSAPDRVFLAERDGTTGWRRLTYGEAWQAAGAIGSALLPRGLSAQPPVVLLSATGLDHAPLTLR